MADIRGKWPWPVNHGHLGTSVEEVKETNRLEKNPDASPIPELGPSQFIDPTSHSESLRVGEPPLTADQLSATGVTLSWVVIRLLLRRARRRGAVLFDQAVDETALDDALPEGRRKQMRRMLKRERKMMEVLHDYNSLAEDVYTLLLANAKG